MSAVVKGNHPLAEVIAKKLFGIDTVPREEQKKMISRACKAAVVWHEQSVDQMLNTDLDPGGDCLGVVIASYYADGDDDEQTESGWSERVNSLCDTFFEKMKEVTE